MEIMGASCISSPHRKSSMARGVVPYSAAILVAVLSLTRAVLWLVASSFANGSTEDLHRRLEASSENAGVWAGLALVAMLMKLTASTDDVVWLLPFLSGDHKRRNAFFYVFCMQLVVVISWGFSSGGEKLLALFVPEDRHWPLARILELMSAILLTIYSLKLFREWWQERHAEEDDKKDEAGSWEVAWDDVSQKWYFRDRQAGISSWQRPNGCKLKIPSAPPPNASKIGVDSAAPLPPGWFTAWDEQTQCEYFYNPDQLLRTWQHPGERMDSDQTAPESDISCPVATVSSHPEPISMEQVHLPYADEDSAAACGDNNAAQSDLQTNAKEVTVSSEDDQESPTGKHTLGKLFTISMFGSLDDFAVFVSLMLSGVLSAGQLVIGVFLGSIIVVAVCAGAGLFSCVVQTVEKIPLWCIIGAFAIWTYIATFAMD